MTSVHAPSWHDDVRACALAFFVPYTLHKFRLTLSFSYLYLWNLSVLASHHFLSADYVCVQLMHFFLFFLCLHAVETFFSFFSCLRALSCPFSFCISAGFYYLSSCIHVNPNFFLVWPNLNHISNTLLVSGWSHLKGVYVFPPHYHVTKFCETGLLVGI